MWCNICVGSVGLTKILDRFPLHEYVLDQITSYRMWDTIRVKFDLLLVMPIERKLLELFKFNPCQIKDEEILDLVKVKWTQYNSDLVFFMSKQFTNSLRCLKDQWSCGRYVTIKRGISQSRLLRLKLMLCMYIIIKGSFWKSKFFGSRI